MKKVIVLFLVGILFLGIAVPTGAFEQIDWAEIWGIMDEEEKAIFMVGALCGTMNDMFLLPELVNEEDEIKVVEFALDCLPYIATYVAFYGEDDNNGILVIGSIDGFYSDP